MKIFIAGSGKLAIALLNADWSELPYQVEKWDSSFMELNERVIIIHAGSGRQFKECATFCSLTNSVLIELSTGIHTDEIEIDFPCIICPNTSILMLRVLNMLKAYGRNFEQYNISILESHQSVKKTVPGTAHTLACILNVPTDKIISVRDPEYQNKYLGIPENYLLNHAFHKITIKDVDAELCIETKILGHKSYVNGIKYIIGNLDLSRLESRSMHIIELNHFNFP